MDGKGYQFVQFKAKLGKRKAFSNALGPPRKWHFRYTLENSASSIGHVRLRSADYGTTGKWYVAKKKRYSRKIVNAAFKQ
jgi:hypothetical protein